MVYLFALTSLEVFDYIMKGVLSMFNVLEKAKNKLAVGVASCMLVFGATVPAFAADPGGTGSTSVADMMGTAFTSVQSDFMSAVGVIAPIALGIFGVFLIWKYGKKIWKVIAG